MSIQRDEVDIKTPDGVAHAWWYRGGQGVSPAVLFLPDAGGIRPAMHAMAERLAKLRYLVLLPNVFYRSGKFRPFDMATVWSDPSERARIVKLISSLTAERIGLDTGAYLDAIAADRGVRRGSIGITGYCVGGRMAFLAAGTHPDKVRAAASFHGGSLATDKPDSPHRLAGRIRASLYFGVADSDPGCPPEQQGALAAALGAARVEYRLELYRGKKHGFAVDDAAAYDREGASRHWEHLEAFFGETLA